MLHTPPFIAFLLTVAFVAFLFRRDLRERPNVTGAVWLPIVWMVLIGTRSVTQWLHLFHFPISFGSAEEGNPIDACVYFALIIAGVYVLKQRQIALSEVLRNNPWLFAFLLYCFLAIAWSDFPFVSFKRWIKVLGHPVMALVLLTEPDFEEALTRLMKRTAYLLVPFSILVIKYYPEIGRKFDEWTGAPANRGIMLHKNMLGGVCMILGFFFFRLLLKTWQSKRSRDRRNELGLIVGLLLMIGWLIAKAHSATSFLSMLIAISVMLLLGRPWLNKRMIGKYVILGVVILVVAEMGFGIFERIVELTGHGKTIDGRAQLWEDLFALHTNPIIGVGFESFWLGDWVESLYEGRAWHPDEAHNGYLEVYLNLGIIGVIMLVCAIVATFHKIRLELLRNLDWGRFRMGFLFAVVCHNWTEATFKGLSLTWFVFYIIAMEYPSLHSMPVEPSFESDNLEGEMEVAYSEAT